MDILVLKLGSRFKNLEANWKVHDATVVRTIVVTAIKEKQVDVDRQSSQVWFGDDVAKYI